MSEPDSGSGLGNGTLLLFAPGLELRLCDVAGELVVVVVWSGDCEGVRCEEGGEVEREEREEGRGVAVTVVY